MGLRSARSLRSSGVTSSALHHAAGPLARALLLVGKGPVELGGSNSEQLRRDFRQRGPRVVRPRGEVERARQVAGTSRRHATGWGPRPRTGSPGSAASRCGRTCPSTPSRRGRTARRRASARGSRARSGRGCRPPPRAAYRPSGTRPSSPWAPSAGSTWSKKPPFSSQVMNSAVFGQILGLPKRASRRSGARPPRRLCGRRVVRVLGRGRCPVSSQET